MEKRFMDIQEMSDYLGVSKWLIYKYVKNREMPFIPFGRLVRFDRVAVDRWAEKRMVRGFVTSQIRTAPAASGADEALKMAEA